MKTPWTDTPDWADELIAEEGWDIELGNVETIRSLARTFHRILDMHENYLAGKVPEHLTKDQTEP